MQFPADAAVAAVCGGACLNGFDLIILDQCGTSCGGSSELNVVTDTNFARDNVGTTPKIRGASVAGERTRESRGTST